MGFLKIIRYMRNLAANPEEINPYKQLQTILEQLGRAEHIGVIRSSEVFSREVRLTIDISKKIDSRIMKV